MTYIFTKNLLLFTLLFGGTHCFGQEENNWQPTIERTIPEIPWLFDNTGPWHGTLNINLNYDDFYGEIGGIYFLTPWLAAQITMSYQNTLENEIIIKSISSSTAGIRAEFRNKTIMVPIASFAAGREQQTTLKNSVTYPILTGHYGLQIMLTRFFSLNIIKSVTTNIEKTSVANGFNKTPLKGETISSFRFIF